MPGSDGSSPKLTTQEERILTLLAAGCSTREISRRLFITEKGVAYHIGHLLGKFGCRSRAGVVGRAFVLGMLRADVWPPQIAPVT